MLQSRLKNIEYFEIFLSKSLFLKKLQYICVELKFTDLLITDYYL